MSRIYQYPVVTEIGNDDYLALGSVTNGSRAILASDLAPVIGNKTITERGTYKASDDNMDGYGQVTVDIPYTDIHVASGDIATFEGEDLPLKSLKVTVTPYQDLHGYDAPWVGGSGKNKLPNSSTDSKSVNSLQINNDKNGKYTISGTATANTFIDFDLADSYVIKSGDYLHFMNSATNSNVSFTLMDGSTLGFNAVFSSANRILDLSNYVGSTVNKIRFYFNANQGMTGTMTPMIVNSNIATTFAPYSNICPIIGWDEAVVTVADDVENPTTSHEYTIDLDGTRYGGVVDATNGTMTVYKEIKTLSASDSFSISSNGERNRISWDYYEYIGKTAGNFIANRLTPKEPAPGGYGSNIWEVFGSSVAPRCWITAPLSIATVSDFTTWLANNPVQLVYELATPITVQLAPTPVKSLEGEDNIFANCGAVDVEYQTVWVRPTN